MSADRQSWIPRVEASGRTDRGKVRSNNEDCFLIDEGIGLALVADGMGGAACGELASSMTASAVRDAFGAAWQQANGNGRLREAIRIANGAVVDAALQEQRCSGMGSTVVAAAWLGDKLSIANVGDSRAYRYRSGALEQLSYDQTLENELRQRAAASGGPPMRYPNRHVLTMAIGSTSDVVVRTFEGELKPGDELLLCSDGLSGLVDDDSLTAILAAGGPASEVTQVLLDRANAAGGTDNITAVLLRFS